MIKRFQDAMHLMRRSDPQKQEDGFHSLRPYAADHVAELIEEFRAEHEDRGLRCWLLELIAEARSPEALPLLTEVAQSEDEPLRDCALRALTLLGTKEARQVLWRERANRPMR
ncbi:HEAT repeat domain-containing protein [Microbispora sp. H10885]|uniref:HEAT repeat domain-containing protein n=1 Tax=Microbispora sp. H10885 TaxID=2729110 RepID=UPI001C729802|nr:HEAT repeat domain-containing protein [Microbispora sp. H10885]